MTKAPSRAIISAMATNGNGNGNHKTGKRAGTRQGEKIAFTPVEIETLSALLRANQTMRGRREYALLRVAVDTMLRSCDVLRLTFHQVMHEGKVVHEFQLQQQKTGEMVVCILTEPARAALAAYIEPFAPAYWEDEETRLFPFTTRRYRQLVKRWCEFLHIKPDRYSTHSLRRTKAKQIYAATGNIEMCRQLLGHTNIRHTEKYLGVSQAEALEWARKIVL